MDRYKVISLRSAHALTMWRRVSDLKVLDGGPVYGCVDWYQYQDDAPLDASARQGKSLPMERGGPAGVAPSVP